jgi:Mg/Co/Ni transporter MgtE
MEPEEAEDVRRLMSYEDYSAGGMMSTEPVVLGADATVADALAAIRRSELPPSLASAVYIVRPPLETPTGRFIGTVYLQRLLRERPGSTLGGLIDAETTPIGPEWQLNEIASYLASYNLLALPIVDENQRLLGAVAIDDLLDHLLPQDWRKRATEMLEMPHG